jgi:GNAT superfamily N-acetyltransferase
MLRQCSKGDFESIYAIINDAAKAYHGVIPPDRWKEPYMPRDELRREMAAGVVFWGYEDAGRLLGVMGIQDVGDVTLIRHAYTVPDHQRKGIGGQLLQRLCKEAHKAVLIGTWQSATWAIRFYEKHDFKPVSPAQKDVLLRKYWDIPDRQVETSVVLSKRPDDEPRISGKPLQSYRKRS